MSTGNRHRPRRRPPRPLPSPFHRHFSEPLLPFPPSPETPSLPRFSTCTDVLSPGTTTPDVVVPRYDEESKVVVSVTVEGSPGPVKAMVRLGATVGEAIGIVVDRYGKEGRSPKIERGRSGREDEGFQLYHSYFCFEGLSKSAKLGDVGGRSFYLRKGKTSGDSTPGENNHNEIELRSRDDCPIGPVNFFLGFISLALNKLGRRTMKLWRIVSCG